MKSNRRVLFIILLFYHLLSCAGQQKTGNNKLDFEVEINIFDLTQSDYSVLSVKRLSLINDLGSFAISKEEINHFFETGDTISIDEASEILSNSASLIYYVMGDISIGTDTLCYAIHASGVGIIYESFKQLSTGRNLLFYKNRIKIPQETYKIKESEIKILCCEKDSFDFSIWEEWKKENPDLYVDNNDEYNAYMRWNKMSAYGICEAFNLSRITTREEIRYDYYLSQCIICGFFIKDKMIYTFWMNGGGAFHLFPKGIRGLEEVYGCFEPECREYFITTLERIDD